MKGTAVSGELLVKCQGFWPRRVKIRYNRLLGVKYYRPGGVYVYMYLIQKHPGCKKRSGQELEKGQDEKDLKSKWAAKAGVALVLMRIKF